MDTNGRKHGMKKRRKRQDKKHDKDARLRPLSQETADIVVDLGRSILLASLPQIAEMTVQAVIERKNLRVAQEMLKGLKVYAGKGEPLEMKDKEFVNRTEEELDYFARTGRWPGEKKEKEPEVEDWPGGD